MCDYDGRDHTASFCKLSFPTGLLVADDGTGEALYIADTGNGRVLKVSDPQSVLDNLELPITLTVLESPTQISKIDFELPVSSTITNVTESADNDLHKGKYTWSDPVITYNLTVTYDTQDVVGPPTCVSPCFRGFNLASDDDYIFDVDDPVEVEGSSYMVGAASGGTYVRLNPSNPNLPGDGKEATVTKEFDAGDYSFFLNLTDVDIPDGFQQITIQPYNETPSELTSNVINLRIGDGELGTSEDTISVEGTYDFPTGLGWNGVSVVPSETPVYVTDFSNSNYDYVSDFAVQGFAFSEPITNRILELYFEAMIGEDSEGNPVWEENTLNANISG